MKILVAFISILYAHFSHLEAADLTAQIRIRDEIPYHLQFIGHAYIKEFGPNLEAFPSPISLYDIEDMCFSVRESSTCSESGIPEELLISCNNITKRSNIDNIYEGALGLGSLGGEIVLDTVSIGIVMAMYPRETFNTTRDTVLSYGHYLRNEFNNTYRHLQREPGFNSSVFPGPFSRALSNTINKTKSAFLTIGSPIGRSIVEWLEKRRLYIEERHCLNHRYRIQIDPIMSVISGPTLTYRKVAKILNILKYEAKPRNATTPHVIFHNIELNSTISVPSLGSGRVLNPLTLRKNILGPVAKALGVHPKDLYNERNARRIARSRGWN